MQIIYETKTPNCYLIVTNRRSEGQETATTWQLMKTGSLKENEIKRSLKKHGTWNLKMEVDRE